MSSSLISRNPDLLRLRDEGYNIAIEYGYLVVREIPYVTTGREIARGTLVTKLAISGQSTGKPEDHTAFFGGEYPCDQRGTPLEAIRNQSNLQQLGDGLVVNHTFSAKPQPSGNYPDFYAKVTAYAALLAGPALALDPSVTAKTFPVVTADGDDGPFHYIDTASTRAEITMATQKLALGRIAIVGVGGTGSYVLDLVAKTPAKEIHLFDGDVFSNHNAFRAPGAASIAALEARMSKVDYLHSIYSKMHRGIFAHSVNVDESNVEELREMDFVFLCLDKPAAKRVIVATLDEHHIPFIDCGMGLQLTDAHSLTGLLRVTASLNGVPAESRNQHISLSENDGNDEYAKNIQVADLNALNAALAVVKFKQHFGFYADLDDAYSLFYSVGDHHINTVTHPQCAPR